MSERGFDGLDRRQLLQLGLAGGTLAAAGSCSLVGALNQADLQGDRSPLSDGEMSRFLGKLDRGLEAIARGPSISHLLPGGDPARALGQAEAARMDALGRKSLRALTFTGMYRSLPQPSRQHPEVKERLAKMAPELDEAVFGTTAALAATDGAERAALRGHLKQDPDLPLRVSTLLDAPARELGVPKESRQQMRHIFAQVGWRMRKQHPSLLIDEYVSKVERAAARHGQTEELSRYLATASFEASLWRAEPDGSHRPGLALSGGDSASAPSRRRVKPPPLEPETPALARARREITAGCWVLGIGALTFAAGAAAFWGGGLFAGAFIMTAGGVILLVGLITAIVGGVRRATNR